jgi:hypothetical protein
MKYAFALLVLIHALIHLMGFAKAFQLGNIESLTQPISKPAGLFWLLTTLLYLSALSGYFMDKPFWPILAIIASVMSQLLIIVVWQDAKFGTLANILIILVALPAIAGIRFQHMVTEESRELLKRATSQTQTLTQEQVYHLPVPVQRWLQQSGAVGKELPTVARIRQTGRMRTAPDGQWMPFTATQYFDLVHPAFVWNTTVQVAPLVTMNGRDKFSDGEGEMLINMLSLIPVVHEGHNTKINTGTMLRYLGETVWFPATVLSPFITWEEVDSLTATASMTYAGTTATGTYYFNSEGDFIAFEADRYYGGGEDARLERWRVEASGYREFNGIRVPYRNAVIWKLPEGDFLWLELELNDLDTNKPEAFD